MMILNLLLLLLYRSLFIGLRANNLLLLLCIIMLNLLFLLSLLLQLLWVLLQLWLLLYLLLLRLRLG